jgi:hypothetical protein
MGFFPKWLAAVAPLCGSLLLHPALAGAQQQPQPSAAAACGSSAPYHALDFWLGTWRVTERDAYAGTDIVTSELSGCAVIERWTDADGSHGISLFLYDPFAGRWSQTWITDVASQVGGLKYKALVARYRGGGVRFQGALPAPAGTPPLLDRTTLTPLPNGTIRQVIELSRDGGDSWSTRFDAVYTRVASHD